MTKESREQMAATEARVKAHWIKMHDDMARDLRCNGLPSSVAALIAGMAVDIAKLKEKVKP